ncbi:MAG: hypothetical protein KatS3mg115_0860 [Candidatus Poribacteria bacterium]|nr:MAG: hypothetical protein KatS3mg115_0860 [Candidatus Poribacteria bacterium]
MASGREASTEFIEGLFAGVGPNVGVALVDPQGRILRTNERWGQILQAVGDPSATELEAAFGPTHWKTLRPAFQRAVSGEEPTARALIEEFNDPPVRVRFRAQRLPREGLLWVRLWLFPAESGIRPRRMAALLELSEEGFLILDEELVIIEATPAVTAITGIPREQLIGQDYFHSPLFASLEPDAQHGVRRALERIRAGERDRVEGWIPYRRPDGTEGFLRGTIANHLDNPALGGIVMVFRDTTREGLTFRDLWRAIESANGAIWRGTIRRISEETLDWDIDFLSSEAAQRLWPLEVPEGQSYLEAWYDARLDEDKRRTDALGAQAVLEGRSRYQQEFRITDKDGQIHWIREDVFVAPDP